MDAYRYDRQDPSSFKGTKRVVTAQAGPYTSLQLPVVICNEQYKSVIDVGLPTSLISTAIWQKINSPLYPIGENEIAERVTRRTNLQLMGYTHIQVQVGQTVLELEDALVYDYDEPEVFLSISAVAALGLIVDFQEGTFGLRSVDGLRCSWNEDTVLFPNNSLGNFSLLNKPRPSADSYTGPINDNHHTSNMVPFGASHKMMGNLNQEMPVDIPVGIDEFPMDIPGLGMLDYNEGTSLPPHQPLDMGPIPQPVPMAPLNPYSMGPVHIAPLKKRPKQRRAVNLTKFKNFYFKSKINPNRPTLRKYLTKIVNWNKDQSKNKPSNSVPPTNKISTNPQKNVSSNQVNANPNTLSKNQKRNAKKKVQAQAVSGAQRYVTKTHCVNCRSNEHTMDKCRKPIALKCVYCGQTGHLRNNCPTVLKTSSATSDKAELSRTSSAIIPANAVTGSPANDNITTPEIATASVTSRSAAIKRPASIPEQVPLKKMVTSANCEVPADSSSHLDDNKVEEASKDQSQETPLPQPLEEIKSASSTTHLAEKEREVACENNIKETPVQQPVQVNKPVGILKSALKVSSSSVVHLSDSDSVKKPDLDTVDRVPVERVLAKKNIKLNMLPKSNTSGTPVPKDEANTGNEVSSDVKDVSLEC